MHVKVYPELLPKEKIIEELLWLFDCPFVD